MRCGVLARCAVAGLTGFFLFSEQPATAETDSWNPFGEKDRAAAIRKRGEQRPATGTDPKGPYLAPMTGPGASRYPAGNGNGLPQPYPATPPGYASRAPFDPKGLSDGVPGSDPRGVPPAGAPPRTPYGAVGTYMPAPDPGTTDIGTAPTSIERGELTPVISSKSARQEGAWQGLDASLAEQLLSSVKLPPVSPALSDLLNRVLAEPVADANLNAVRIQALLKAGQVETAARLRGPPASNLAANSGEPGDLLKELMHARLDLATSRSELGCIRIKSIVAAQANLPKHVRGEAIIMAGYCAVLAGNRQAAGLAAQLARDAGYSRPFTLALLEAIASGENVRAPLPDVTSTLDAMLAGKLKTADAALIEGMLQRADAGFLHLVATDANARSSLRLMAAERGAAANISSPATLAEAYRAASDSPIAQPGNENATATSATLERAHLFAAAERQQAQFAKTRAIRTLLDSARRDGLYHAMAVAIAPIVGAMRPAQEISWFSETAVEVLAASGDYPNARQWVQSLSPSGSGQGVLDHWLMLLDIADPGISDRNRGRSIAVLENFALQGRFSRPALHRLATVLDALDYNVPIPLWNLASRTGQPETGHLPETGILFAMKKASQAHQIAATTLFALRTIAPAGTTATHLLGLGDTIRALKRAGLEKDARRLAFEALFSDWPRTGG